MRTLTIFILAVIPCAAQQSFSTVGLLNSSGTNQLTIKAPAGLAANATLTQPAPTGMTGCVQDSTGTGVLIIASCANALVAPITITGMAT